MSVIELLGIVCMLVLPTSAHCSAFETVLGNPQLFRIAF